jgi:hypothetical protein
VQFTSDRKKIGECVDHRLTGWAGYTPAVSIARFDVCLNLAAFA